MIPLACTPLAASSHLLDCWLEHNPKVAQAIVWEPAPGFPTAPLLSWPEWSATMKAELRQAWVDARNWHASGQVFQAFEKYGYTVAALEATQLWQRLAQAAQQAGKC